MRQGLKSINFLYLKFQSDSTNAQNKNKIFQTNFVQHNI